MLHMFGVGRSQGWLVQGWAAPQIAAARATGPACDPWSHTPSEMSLRWPSHHLPRPPRLAFAKHPAVVLSFLSLSVFVFVCVPKTKNAEYNNCCEAFSNYCLHVLYFSFSNSFRNSQNNRMQTTEIDCLGSFRLFKGDHMAVPVSISRLC